MYWHFLHNRCNGYTAIIRFLELGSGNSCTRHLIIIQTLFVIINSVLTFPAQQMKYLYSQNRFHEIGCDISCKRDEIYIPMQIK